MEIETWFMFEVKINGNEGFLHWGERIPREYAPVGYPYMYYLRHDEDDGMEPISIENYVLVNFFGTIFFKQPIIFGKEVYVDINEFKYLKQIIPYKLRKLMENEAMGLYKKAQ